MSGKGKPPEHGDAPLFPLDYARVWGGGVGNAARNGLKVTIPGNGLTVRVVDWTHPHHLDVPLQVTVYPQDNEGTHDASWFWENTPYNRVRGVIAYARGQQKIREAVGMSANGIVWRGTAREFTLDLGRADNAEHLDVPALNIYVIASITPGDYIPQRTRQGSLFTFEDSYIAIPQRVPYGATRYRASVTPWGTIAEIEWFGNAVPSGLQLDSVPVLSVADWQALPVGYDSWQQDSASLNLVLPPPYVGHVPNITLEFE